MQSRASPRAGVSGSPTGDAPRIILFDGVCNLCNGFVQFVIARDPAARFRFAALSSPAAERILEEAGVTLPIPDTVVLVEEGVVYVRSDAPLRIARGLTFPWPLAYGLAVVPRFIRDRVYDVIAAHRYKWFGRRDSCMVPTPEMDRRFLR
jgi:predicted DCC family thiol-disulfide oxidoreductase YuxK